MTQGESRDGRAADSIREAARRALSEARRRVALDPDGTRGDAPPLSPPNGSAPPSPPAGAKRTVAAPPGAPEPAAARPADAPAVAGTGRGGAPGGAAADGGDAGRAARRAAFDRWFDRTYPDLARPARPAPPVSPGKSAPAVEAPRRPALQPRQLTAARLLLAGRRVTEVAARLGVDRHTLADWMKDPAFQREVRRMAVELPLDELAGGGGGDGAGPA